MSLNIDDMILAGFLPCMTKKTCTVNIKTYAPITVGNIDGDNNTISFSDFNYSSDEEEIDIDNSKKYVNKNDKKDLELLNDDTSNPINSMMCYVNNIKRI